MHKRCLLNSFSLALMALSVPSAHGQRWLVGCGQNLGSNNGGQDDTENDNDSDNDIPDNSK
jgi:hypothetical protein